MAAGENEKYGHRRARAGVARKSGRGCGREASVANQTSGERARLACWRARPRDRELSKLATFLASPFRRDAATSTRAARAPQKLIACAAVHFAQSEAVFRHTCFAHPIAIRFAKATSARKSPLQGG